eukprot:2510871-Prymnesium_polylepis.1
MAYSVQCTMYPILCDCRQMLRLMCTLDRGLSITRTAQPTARQALEFQCFLLGKTSARAL